MEISRVEQYVILKGWAYKLNGKEIEVEICPHRDCGKTNHFSINIVTEQSNCFRCGKGSKTLASLKKKLGDKIDGVFDAKNRIAPMQISSVNPKEIEENHQALMEDDDVIDWLVSTRGFKLKVIEQKKLGLTEKFFRKLGRKARALAMPYYRNGKPIFIKYRTVPPDEKDFVSTTIDDLPLYNEDALLKGYPEIFAVEGESDTLSMLSVDMPNVVGIPGAGTKKSEWVTQIDESNPAKIYLCYDSDEAGQSNVVKMAEKIGIDKCYLIKLPEFETVFGNPGKDLNEFLRLPDGLERFLKLKEQARLLQIPGVRAVADILMDQQDKLERGEDSIPEFDTPWADLTGITGHFDRGDVIGITAQAKQGKAQPLSVKIKTPDGWTTLGKLSVGDTIASIDGKPSIISGIYPQGKKQIYKVTLSDGRSTKASGDHLWSVYRTDSSLSTCITVTTESLIELLKLNKRKTLWAIPKVSGIFEEDLPTLVIDPYILGVLLGDGDITQTTPSIHARDKKIESKVLSKLPADSSTSSLSFGKNLGFRIIKKERTSSENQVTAALKKLKLHGADCFTKFIPSVYMTASYKDRLELLHGLIDTDGAVGKDSYTYVATSSPELSKNVQELVWSLGGVSKIKYRKFPRYLYKGVKKTGQPAYRVSVVGLDKSNLSCVPLKSGRCKPKKLHKKSHLTIKAINPEGTEECQCISVTHPSRLYITDDYIVTHNTTVAINWLDYYARTKKYSVFMYCLEMSQERLVKKWMSCLLEKPDSITTLEEDNGIMKEVYKTNFNIDDYKRVRGIVAEMQSDYLFGFTRFKTSQDIFETIYQTKRRYGIDIICFDNLHLLAREVEHRASELDNLSKQFKQVTMELKILTILLMQPTKPPKGGALTSFADARGSVAMTQDVDCGISLSRPAKQQVTTRELRSGGRIEFKDAFEPTVIAMVEFARNAPGGACTLKFDGAISKVSSLDRV